MKMSSERVEWVEIIEPKTKEHMYANLTTGECVWDPPEGVKVKRTDSNQWWELFDINTHRFYYFNASTQTTVWHRPTDCDIIPLAKLQTLKQNTDPQKRRESATQTNQTLQQVSSLEPVSSNGNAATSNSKVSPSNSKSVTITQTSPVRSKRTHLHQKSINDGRRIKTGDEPSIPLFRHTDSGRSSDSSISSAQRRKQQEVVGAGTPQQPRRRGPSGDVTVRHGPSGDVTARRDGPSGDVTARRDGVDRVEPLSGLNRSGSFVSPRKDASDDSMHEKYFKSVESTPLTRRKLKQQSTGSSCDSASPQSPSSPLHKPQPSTFIQSTSSSVGGVGSRLHSLERPTLLRHARDRYSDRHLDKERLLELDRSMDRYHDKQAVYSVDKPIRQTSLDLRHNAQGSWQGPREFTRRQLAEPERLSLARAPRRHEPFIRQGSANEADSLAGANYKMKCVSLEPPLTEPNLQRHNQRLELGTAPKDRTKSRRHKRPEEEEDRLELNSDEDEDGAGSPLYSNWDLRGMQHLVPLQDYIIQQAKLSGGDTFGSCGSLSGSGSAASGSLSGHEPDNESSDGGRTPDTDDTSGVYLPHTPAYLQRASDVEYMNHGVSYYNTFVGFERDRQPSPGIHRTLSNCGAGGGGPGPPPPRTSRSPPPEQDIEVFAKDNLNFSKGIFRKKASVRDLLSWTGRAISAPMVGVNWDKLHKKEACGLFRLVQIYMGDRKARPGMTLNSVAQDILHAAFTNEKLRDELYVQLCRQTTEHPLRDSLLRGWELLCVCLAFVPPSRAFQPALTNYVNRHRDPAFADAFPEVGKWPIHVQVSHYAGVACTRLERIGVGGRRQPRRPATDDIDQARIQIFRQSMFGNTLEEVMALQKERFPNRQLPWVQVALSQQVLALNGKETEGIFRVSADVDEVNALKTKIDNWELPDISTLTDAHAPAHLLKLWYRSLYEPLIPDSLYGACVSAADMRAASLVLQRLPAIHRAVLTYLISFLQEFATPEVVSQTKMDSANLAMVFAPNCLRCTSQDPRVILENARREMTFLKCLITHMDTSHVRDML